MGIEGGPRQMFNESEPPAGSRGESLDPTKPSQGIEALGKITGPTESDAKPFPIVVESYSPATDSIVERISSEGSPPYNSDLKAPDRLIEAVQRSPFGPQKVHAGLLAEIAGSAKALGPAGQAISDTASRIAANCDGTVELSPIDAADLLSGLKSAIDIAGQSTTTQEQLERQLEAHEGLIKYLFVNQEMIQRSLSTRERALDIGGTAAATTIPTAIAAGIFVKPIAEEVATTLLEVAFGGGLVLLVRASIEFIRSSSSSLLDAGVAVRQAADGRLDKARTVQDLLDQRSHTEAAVATAEAAVAATNALLEAEHRRELELLQQDFSHRDDSDGDSFAR